MNIHFMNGGTLDHVGFIPSMISELDPRPAREQFDANYQHGGGWNPLEKFDYAEARGNSIAYPGNPRMWPMAMFELRGERIFVYESAWVCIVQPDGSFEVARMD